MNRITDKFKQRTLVFDVENHSFIINSLNSKIIFRLFHYKDSQKSELIMKKSFKIWDLYNDNPKIRGIALKPDCQF